MAGVINYLVSSRDAAVCQIRIGFLLVLLLVSLPISSDAASTLFHGQSLSGNQTIVSKGEVFELGFFQPGESTRFYIGIWYKKLTPRTVVWVANRVAPVSDPTACQFKISDDGGRLILLVSRSNQIVWSAPASNNYRTTSNDTTTTSSVVLHDDGNLVFQDPKEAATPIIWQSFDNPTDTRLPGSWLGRNNTSGDIQKLVSWKSYDDPAPGRFSYGLQPGRSTEYFLTWNNTKNYWTTGRWNGRWFDNIPEMAQGANFNKFTFINNDRWTAFYYNSTSRHTIRSVLDPATGQVQQFHWMESFGKWGLVFVSPKHVCEVYALCGSFGVCIVDPGSCRCLEGFEPTSPTAWSARDWSEGCSRRSPLRCGGAINSSSSTVLAVSPGIKEGNFKALPNMKLPANPQRIIDLEVRREQDCKLACLKYFDNSTTGSDCSCTAYSFENRVCSIWIGDLLNLQQLAEGDTAGGILYLRVSEEEMLKKSRQGKISKAALVVGAAGAGVVTLLFLGMFWFYNRRKDRKALKHLGDGSSLIVFTCRQLQSATKNFSEMLGAGGFGSVFRGVLTDATPVAVKKLAQLQRASEKQFRAEVSTLGKVQHVNLVRLRGFCCSGPNRLLVYDFMPNGSLNRYLGGSDTALNWRTRYNIMLGVARGLAYLHEDCTEQILHCDVKPENILLNADFCPKVADFGMAKLIGRDFSRALTTMRGTRGYLAPEWISGHPITPKIDVYSYGMMLLELVSGKRNNCEFMVGDDDVYRPLWAATKVNEGHASDVVDPILEGDFDEQELERACRVACWCIQGHEEDRPTMRVIVQVLEGVVDLGIPPIPKSLMQLIEVPTPLKFFTEFSSKVSNMYPSYSVS